MTIPQCPEHFKGRSEPAAPIPFPFIGGRRRLPPTPRERARLQRSADLSRGVVRVASLINARGFCFAMVHHRHPYGEGAPSFYLEPAR